MFKIQKLLGHASVSTTRRYIAVDAARLLDMRRAAYPRVVDDERQEHSPQP